MKITKKVISILLALLILIPGIGAVSAYAVEGQAIPITIDGKEYKGTSFLKDSVTYVGIREFSSVMGASYVLWDSVNKTATVKSDNLRLSAKNSDSYIIANDRYLWAETGVIIISDTMYVPIRTIAKAFCCDVQWNGKTRSVSLTKRGGTLTFGKYFYNSNDLYWLARIISAEAGVEPFYGKVAVGTVVLNRCRSTLYPDTVKDVVFDTKFGVQFTPAANGTVYNYPDDDSIIAAKLCLDGASISDSVLFFVNDAIAENSWVRDNRTYVTTIGSHNFYS